MQWKRIEQAIEQPWGRVFRITRRKGRWQMGDPLSHYDGNTRQDLLTFDIANGSMLVNHGCDGALKALTFYRETYRSCCNPQGWPGVWLAKDNSSHGPYSYSLTIDGETVNLAQTDWDVTTGLLDNIFPITRLVHPRGHVEATILSFAPVSADGAERPQGVVYGIHLRNVSGRRLAGHIGRPAPFPRASADLDLEKVNWSTVDPYGYEFADADTDALDWTVPFSLEPGGTVWVPTVLYVAAGNGAAEIRRLGSLEWLCQTWQYHRRFLGRLAIDTHPYLGEFYERQMLQALHCIGLSGNGRMAGSNWGTYPATRQIWSKDTFYSCLPVVRHDPRFAREIIDWFHRFGVRQEGAVVKGGLFHSVSLSVASIILGGIYYETTGDRGFFEDHAAMVGEWRQLLEAVVGGRESEEVWIVPTAYISDGKVECDRHAGSNVCVWRALLDYARIAEEVFGDTESAGQCRGWAERIARSIRATTLIDGTFGRQYVEGTNRDGSVPRMESDGEESETTLMPFYGFAAYDDPAYLNTMRFAHSTGNALYDPELHAIGWKGVPSTAPGYAKALSTGSDSHCFGDHGAFTEIRRVSDADGSVWWWSYGGAARPSYGHVVRGIPGKSGWFAGVYATLFVSRFLGLAYDAVRGRLSFRPLDSLGGFSWAGFPIGAGRFSVSYRPAAYVCELEIENENPREITASIEMLLPGDGHMVEVEVDGVRHPGHATGRYFERNTAIMELQIPAGSGKKVKVRNL